MSSAPTPYYFRRRMIGRAASPPTWACYEQIPYDEDEYSDSCSEDDEDYSRGAGHSPSSETDNVSLGNEAHDVDSMDMDIDTEADGQAASKKEIKGKQRAIDPEPEQPRRRHRQRTNDRIHALRPILTIHRSQGFVWNQVGPLEQMEFY